METPAWSAALQNGSCHENGTSNVVKAPVQTAPSTALSPYNTLSTKNEPNPGGSQYVLNGALLASNGGSKRGPMPSYGRIAL